MAEARDAQAEALPEGVLHTLPGHTAGDPRELKEMLSTLGHVGHLSAALFLYMYIVFITLYIVDVYNILIYRPIGHRPSRHIATSSF